MRHSVIRLALAAGSLFLARPALAQTPDAPPGLPTCASLGLRRVAVMIPPGQTRAQLEDALRRGGLFPAGTQAMVLQPGELMPLRNHEQFNARMRNMLSLFLEQGFEIQGTAYMLVEVDDEGVVTRVHANTGNAEVNRLLARTWRQARFEPWVFDGCRASAWVQVPQTFKSDWSGPRREVELRTNAPPP
jgi:hypothetical protein